MSEASISVGDAGEGRFTEQLTGIQAEQAGQIQHRRFSFQMAVISPAYTRLGAGALKFGAASRLCLDEGVALNFRRTFFAIELIRTPLLSSINGVST
jgi:hypothetical protein